MLCPECGKENAGASGDCPSCGQAVTQMPAVSAEVPAPPPFFSETLKLQQRRSAIPIAVVVVTVVMIVGSHLFSASIQFDGQTQQRVRRLFREAEGRQAVQNSIFPSERRVDNLVREQYRNQIRSIREYTEAVKNADRSALKQLYTPGSFVYLASASEGLKQLHALYDLDMAYYQKTLERAGNILQAFEDNISSPSERQAFREELNGSPFTPLRRVMIAERAWIQTVDDVYGYAQSNHSAFVLKNGLKLAIKDERIRAEFNSKIQTMNARRNEFMQEGQEVKRLAAEQRSRLGVTVQELGLQ